jgi:Flp pilus assembly protein TadD
VAIPSQLRLFVFAVLTPTICACAQSRSDTLDHQFQSAVAHYHAGQLAEAATELQSLLSLLPKSFEAHELLGLVYAAQGDNTKAVDHLQIAVHLKPDSGAARTNLATALAHAHQPALAEEQFRKALDLEPQAYDANHNLAEFYIQSRKLADALPLLEAAQRAKPTSYDNGYDLALTCYLLDKLDEATQTIQTLEQQQNTGELHTLLGQIDEKEGRFIEAAQELGIAAHMDPSEDSLFAWGSELLLHRTYEPAVDVFKQAIQRYPNSPRLRTGLGMALYSRGEYDEAVKSLLAAADLDPADPRCYLFLSKAYLSSPNQADDVIQRFQKYAELKPKDALAQYYYAISLWKGKRSETTSIDFKKVESLLQKASALDPSLAEPHLQLGIIYNDQHDYAKSLPEYQHALQLDPNSPDVHYRLGQYYVHAGQKDQAQQEFAVYDKLKKEHMAAVDKERAEVKQFVYAEQGTATAKP